MKRILTFLAEKYSKSLIISISLILIDILNRHLILLSIKVVGEYNKSIYYRVI